MPKQPKSNVSGYKPDIVKNKQLLDSYNRHDDSYSVFDLSPEIILVSARLSEMLFEMSYEDPEIKAMMWGEVFKVMELKRKLIETKLRGKNLEFRQDIAKEMAEFKMTQAKSIPISDVKLFVSEIVQIAQQLLDKDKVNDFLRMINAKQNELEKVIEE